jgi:hypothetical protein
MQVAGIIAVTLFYIALAIGAINLITFCILDGDD